MISNIRGGELEVLEDISHREGDVETMSDDDILWMYGKMDESFGAVEVPFWQNTAHDTKRSFRVVVAAADSSFHLIEDQDVGGEELLEESSEEEVRENIHLKGCTSFMSSDGLSVTTTCHPKPPYRQLSLVIRSSTTTMVANLDFSSVRHLFGPTIVKTTTFLLPSMSSTLLKVNVVDEHLNIFVIQLDLSLSFNVLANSSVQFIPSLLKHSDNVDNYNKKVNIGRRLSSNNQCDWINHDILVFAVAPHLQCFSIEANSIQTWISSNSLYLPASQQQNRRKSIMKTVTNAIWQLMEVSSPTSHSNFDSVDNTDSEQVIDMDDDECNIENWNRLANYDDEEEENASLPVSTAALTVIRTTPNKDDEDSSSSLVSMPIVITLHSDGTMRKWVMLPNLDNSTRNNNKDWLLPIAVHKLRVLVRSSEGVRACLSPPIPPSREWSPSPDAVHLTARFYAQETKYAIALSVQTYEKQQHIYVFSSKTFFNTYGALLEDDTKTSTVISCFALHPPMPYNNSSIVNFSLKDNTEEKRKRGQQQFHLYCLFCYYPRKDSNIRRTGIAKYNDWTSSPIVTNFASDAISDQEYIVCKHFACDDKTSPDITIEQLYMKLLFKSVFPRPFGGIHPLDSVIQQSLVKICPFYTTKKNSNSIQAETLMVMRQWKAQQQQGSYDKHWQRLLLTIREEEAWLQRPVLIAAEAHPALLIRTGYSSLLFEIKKNSNAMSERPTSVTALLDKTCLILLHQANINKNGNSSGNFLNTIECLIKDVVTSGRLLSDGVSQQLLPQIQNILNTSSNFMKMIVTVAKEFIQMIDSMDEPQLLEWTNSSFTKLAPEGLLDFDSTIRDHAPSLTTATTSVTRKNVIEMAIYLSRMHLECARKLSLSRCLVLCAVSLLCDETSAKSALLNGALLNASKVLLEMTALQWASSEPCCIASIDVAKGGNLLFQPNLNQSNSEAAARRNYSSLPLLEAEISRMMDTLVKANNSSSSIFENSLQLACQLSAAFYRKIITESSGCVIGLSMKNDVDASSSFFSRKLLPPRLLLRLLAPSISLETRSTWASVTHLVNNLYEKKTVAAECMLKEAAFAQKYKLLSDDQCKLVREAALELFESAEQDTALAFLVDDHDESSTAINANDTMFLHFVEDDVSSISSKNQKTLALAVQRLVRKELLSRSPLLPGVVQENFWTMNSEAESAPCLSICRLVQLPSCSTWLLHLVNTCSRSFSNATTAAFSENDIFIALEDLVNCFPEDSSSIPPYTLFWSHLRQLQRISHMVSLLELAERNTADHSLMLRCALKGIASLLALSPEIMPQMPECSNLWSAVFRHAAKIHNWDQAFDACRNNPVECRRRADFRRLVTFMVEAGSLDKLLLLPKTVDDSISFDLYEAAASALADKAREECNSSSDEYYRSLYSLFCFLGEWRRSATVMDDWYESIISRGTYDIGQWDEKAGDSRHRTLSLAAVACLNSLELIDDANFKFLVGDPAIVGGDCVSRLKSYSDVDQRALVALSLDLLRMDTSLASLFSDQVPTLPEVISALCSTGHYFHAIALAMKADHYSNDAACKDSQLTKVLCDFSAYAAALTTAESATVSFGSNDAVVYRRPTLVQISFASQSPFCGYVGSCAESKAALDLLCMTVSAKARADNGLALEVAKTMLDVRPDAALPPWLFALIIGEQESGVFASSKMTHSPKNPSALLKLFMERGLLLPAVEVVVSLLTGKSDGGEKMRFAATRRVPEKGNIDYVPYPYIDLLYNLISKAESLSGCTVDEKEQLALGRKKIENALKFHMKLLCVSQEALQSARVI